MVRRVTRGMSAGLLLAALGGLSGCGEEACPEPSYGGEATDEAYRALVDTEGRATEGGSGAATLSAPEADTVLKAGEAPTFSWQSSLAWQVAPAPGRQRLGPSPQLPARQRSGWAALWQALLPVAHAHGTPLTGDAHLVRVSVEGERCPIEHFTTQTVWKPTVEAWAQVARAAPGEVRVQVLSAWFRDNAVEEGPYLSAATSLRVEE